jgi:hypothetical protein
VIVGGVTLEQVDEAYQRMGIKELVVFPWYEDGPPRKWGLSAPQVRKLVGLITGCIDIYPPFIGKSAFLEHLIVLPEAKHKLQVMLEMPKAVIPLLRERGAERILLCIGLDDPRRPSLDAWARRCGYTKFGGKDDSDWYLKPLTAQGWAYEAEEASPKPAGDTGRATPAASTS